MRLKSLAILVPSILPTVAFVLSHLGQSTRPSKLSSSNATDVVGSPKPRDIISFLTTRYGEGDWTKTRNYVYQAQEKLSIQQVDKVLNFLDNNFDIEQTRSILQRSPRILRKNPKSKLQPITKFLEQLYGKDMFHEAVARNSDLLLISGLGYDDILNAKTIESYLQRELRFSPVEIRKMQEVAPFFFQIPLQKIELVSTYLISLLRAGGFQRDESIAIVAKVVTAHPHLFHLNVEANLKPRIDFLAQTCKLSRKNVATLIKTSSGILGLSVEENLKPTIGYLLQILNQTGDAGREALNKCIMNHPPILALSQRNMHQKVQFFNAMDSGNEDVHSLAARIAMRHPVVYSLSLKDNIVPTVEFLSKIWGSSATHTTWGGSQELVVVHPPESTACDVPLGTLLRDFPGILTLSLEGNLQPTLNFYNKTGYTKLDEEWNLVKDKPRIRGRYVAASLFHRLLPRWHYWMEHDSAVKPPLHVIAGSTDASFCKQLGFDLQEFMEFNKQSGPRLKFSSQFDTWLKTGRAFDV